LERLQEDIMQANLKRGKAASGARSAGRFVAILAGVPLIATLTFSAPSPALAAECGASHPAHAASTSGGSVHTTTSIPAASGGGGGSGNLGCANGSSSASPLRGLPTTASGKVVENSVHAPARTAVHTRTATTKTANTGAHLRGVKAPHA
jgi:hypothetical protein